MTVAELMERLRRFPPDMQVLVEDREGLVCPAEYVEEYTSRHHGHGVLVWWA